MNKKAIFSLLSLSAFALTSVGAPLTPREALVRLADFAGEAPSLRMKAPAADKNELVYTASAEGMTENAFYIFNQPSGGFIILSADDRLPAVLGFSDNGSFDYNRISPDMKWWLGEYQKDIARLYSAEGVDVSARESSFKKAAVVERNPIEPMLTTRWDQMAPYNMMSPNQYPTGCVATAMAQVMKYHEWPVAPTGSHGGVDFEGTVYDWENMIDIYEKGRYTTQEAEAVATLMRQCGASVDMMYSPYASGAFSFNVPIALYTYFGYSPAMKLEFRDYHKMSEWNDIVYAELEGNRPVYYSGASSAGGHAFVCDGYLGKNFFHFNWGWGGYQDGYFLLNALNPGVGGTGSFAGGYNTQQTIVTGVKKSEGETAKPQVALLTTGGFEYDHEKERFCIGAGTDSYRIIYNPLGYVVSGNIGLKVTPMDGGDPKYFQGMGFSLQTSYYIENYTTSVTGLADGVYKCEPAFISEGEWYPVQVVVGTQPYVTLKVEGGKYTYSNEGLPADEIPSLLAGIPRSMPVIFGDGAKIFRATVINVNGGDYNNNLTLSLYEEGKEGKGLVREVTNFVTVPGNAALDVDFVLEKENVPASFEVYLMDYEGKNLLPLQEGKLLSAVTVKTIDSGRGLYDKAQMVFTEISPNFWTSSEAGIGLVMTATNKYFAQVTQDFYVKILNAGNFSEDHSFGPFSLTLDSGKHIIVNFTSEDFKIDPGYYYWQVTDKKGNNLSALYPLMVTSETREKDGVYYQVTSEKSKTARIVNPTLGEYEGTIVVPSQIDGYNVTDMRDDAFTFAEDLTSVTLPHGIKSIENGAFYRAKSLREFQMRSTTPPALYPKAFAEGQQGEIKFGTYSGVSNLYAHLPLWSDFNFSSWNITLEEGVSLDPEHLEIDPFTGSFYNPYYISFDEVIAFTATSDDPEMGFRALIDIDGVETTQDFWRTVWLPALNGAQGNVKIIAVPGLKVEDAAAEQTVTVVRLDGVKVLEEAPADALKSLPRGLYIVNGRKVAL